MFIVVFVFRHCFEFWRNRKICMQICIERFLTNIWPLNTHKFWCAIDKRVEWKSVCKHFNVASINAYYYAVCRQIVPFVWSLFAILFNSRVVQFARIELFAQELVNTSWLGICSVLCCMSIECITCNVFKCVFGELKSVCHINWREKSNIISIE